MKFLVVLLLLLLPSEIFAKVDLKLYDTFTTVSLYKTDSSYYFSMADTLLQQLEKDPDPDIYMMVVGAMGIFLQTHGHFQQALPLLHKALKVKNHHNNFLASKFALAISSIYLSSPDIPQAFYYLKMAKKLFAQQADNKTDGYRFHQKRLLNAELQIYRALGLYGLALDKLNLALQKKQPYFYDLFRVAELYHSLNDFDNALTSYNKVLERLDPRYAINLKLRVHVINRMGDIYFDREEYAKALRYYKRSEKYAREIKYRKYIWAAHLDRAYTFAHMGEIDSALWELKALSRVRYHPPVRRVGHLNAVKSMVYTIKGEIDSAVFYARKGLKVLESQRKKIKISDVRQAVFKKNKVNFDQMKYALFEKYRQRENPALIDSLYKYSILSRGRMYGEKSSPDTSSESYHEYLDASGDLEAFQLRQRVAPEFFGDSLKAMLSVKRFRLVDARISMINKKNATHYRSFLSLAALKAKMKRRNAALVIYDLNPYRPFAIYVGPTKIKLIPFNFKVRQLKDSLSVYVDQLFNGNAQNKSLFNAQLSFYLYKQLWFPLDSRIRMPDDVMIIPDIDMAVLPLETLLQKSMPQTLYSVQDSAPYWEKLLIHKHNFSYLPGVYSLNDTLTFTAPRALILGDPLIEHDRHGRGLPSLNSQPLYYARAEAQAVNDLIPGSQLFLGEKATETAFLENADRYSIWHFATHARYDADYYNMSFIALSADSVNGKDGLLMAYEIQNMQQAPKLVTISACNSGVGPVLEGEGTLSLARFFMINDAENIIVTQWDVSDAYSASLMKTFYRKLIPEKTPSLSGAFTQAKIEVAETGGMGELNFKHPSFWAAFRLYGDTPNVFIHEKNRLKWWLAAIFFFLFAGVLAFRRFHL